MNAVKELVISIKSLFNKQGSEDAEKALDKVGQKAEAAGKKTEEAAKRGGKEMDEGAKKAHGLGGAIKGMSEKAELFGKVMRGLGVVGIVSLIALPTHTKS